MSWRGVIWTALIVVGLWQGWQQWRLRPLHQPDGTVAPNDPVQTQFDSAAPITHGRWQITPRARYDITARILSREDYRFDAMADLAPEDLALGWGPMSDNRILQAFQISQAARFYSWRPTARLPIPREDVIEHSANTHVIPASAAIASQLKLLRTGQIVHLTGLLIDGMRDDGRWVRTSLTRSDTGDGACEVMFVEQLEVF